MPKMVTAERMSMKSPRRAGVNKATLYYQIGDKDTLYANVIHQVIGNTAQGIAEAVAKADHPEEKLKAYITLYR